MHIHFDEIDSTNAYAKAHRAELEDLSFVSASYQTSGRGREERIWRADKGENLLFSVLLKDPETVACGPFLGLVAAVSLSALLEREYGIRASIKWPNDVYVNGKKIAGILLEGVGSDCLVIGVGVNVNQVTFSGDYRTPPTSVSKELGKPIDLEVFRDKVFESLEASIRSHKEKEPFLAYYGEHDYLSGRKVAYRGLAYTVIGVDEEFRLLLGDGKTIIPVISGEIDSL